MNRCFQCRNNGAAKSPIADGKSSTPFFILIETDAPGEICQVIFRHMVLFRTTIILGGEVDYGKSSTRLFALNCAWLKDAMPNQVPLVWIAKVSKQQRLQAREDMMRAAKVKGRKHHILVDTLGLLLIVVVHAASIQDRDGAKLVLEQVPVRFPRVALIWADGGYAGQLVSWVKENCQRVLEIVKRSDKHNGFKVLPHRWVVERTFGWFNRYRRLAKDYERSIESSEAMLYIAMIRLVLARLAKKHQAQQQQPSQDCKTHSTLAA